MLRAVFVMQWGPGGGLTPTFFVYNSDVVTWEAVVRMERKRSNGPLSEHPGLPKPMNQLPGEEAEAFRRRAARAFDEACKEMGL